MSCCGVPMILNTYGMYTQTQKLALLILIEILIEKHKNFIKKVFFLFI